MELHQLRYFHAIAQTGSFTRAAKQCHVSQPSLSQQIAKLEHELQHPLFERLGRTVKLTEAGRILYKHAGLILESVTEAKRQVMEKNGPQYRNISIGCIPTIAPYFLPRILPKFKAHCPDVEVVLHEDTTERLVKACVDCDLDLAILALPIKQDALKIEPLFREELLLALPPEHPLVKKRRITLDALQHDSFILLKETHCLGQQIISFCHREECLPSMTCESTQLLTVIELVSLGHGISLIPKMACMDDKEKRCVYRSLSGSKPERTIAVGWHKSRHRTKVVDDFLHCLRKHSYIS